MKKLIPLALVSLFLIAEASILGKVVKTALLPVQVVSYGLGYVWGKATVAVLGGAYTAATE